MTKICFVTDFRKNLLLENKVDIYIKEIIFS